jgi:transketolase
MMMEITNLREKAREISKRDRLVLSKGHAYPVLYSVLAEKGYFDKKRETD